MNMFVRRKPMNLSDSDDDDNSKSQTKSTSRSSTSGRDMVSAKSPRDEYQRRQIGSTMRPTGSNYDDDRRHMTTSPRGDPMSRTAPTSSGSRSPQDPLMNTMRKPLDAYRRGDGRVGTPTAKTGGAASSSYYREENYARSSRGAVDDRSTTPPPSRPNFMRSAGGRGAVSPSSSLDDSSQSPRSKSPGVGRSLRRSPEYVERRPSGHAADSDDYDRNEHIKQTRMLSNLLPESRRGEGEHDEQPRDEREAARNEREQQEEQARFLEKDPKVIETAEDPRITEKLQREREEKKRQRESAAKNKTEATKALENAIDKVETTNEDNNRLQALADKMAKLSYPTKPPLDATKIIETKAATTARPPRARSASSRGSSATVTLPGSRRRYAHVKPKTVTRLAPQSARPSSGRESQLSNTDVMNDSSSLRQAIYNEWYQKKLEEARDKLKDAQLRQKDEEEKLAQAKIDSLKKAKQNFDTWNLEKNKMIVQRIRQLKNVSQKVDEDKQAKEAKKKDAEKAYEIWLKNKKEFEFEKKEELNETKRKAEHEKRDKEREKEKLKQQRGSYKPPVPFDTWVQQKDKYLSGAKVTSSEEKQALKAKEEAEKRKKAELARQCYDEWLDNKYRELERAKTVRTSSSMSALPPFYPSSRTIPQKRH